MNKQTRSEYLRGWAAQKQGEEFNPHAPADWKRGYKERAKLDKMQRHPAIINKRVMERTFHV